MGSKYLTPRERQVFDLLRIGLTNEEIASRLGISLDGAKYHVSQILSKLGVSSREEAVFASEPAQRPTRAIALIPLALAACLVAAVAVGAGIFALSAMRSDETSSIESPTPTDVLTIIENSYASNIPPHIGDHWHASYQIYVGDELQPRIPEWESGVHTHGDGIIHIHPFQGYEEGQGASIGKFFEYGGGELTGITMRIPGFSTTYRDGDPIEGEDGLGHIYIIVNGRTRVSENYIPQDGDRLYISFTTEDLIRAYLSSVEPVRPLSGSGTATPPVTAEPPP